VVALTRCVDEDATMAERMLCENNRRED